MAAAMGPSRSHRGQGPAGLYEYRLSNEGFADAFEGLNPRILAGSPHEHLLLEASRKLAQRS